MYLIFPKQKIYCLNIFVKHLNHPFCINTIIMLMMYCLTMFLHITGKMDVFFVPGHNNDLSWYITNCCASFLLNFKLNNFQTQLLIERANLNLSMLIWSKSIKLIIHNRLPKQVFEIDSYVDSCQLHCQRDGDF